MNVFFHRCQRWAAAGLLLGVIAGLPGCGSSRNPAAQNKRSAATEIAETDEARNAADESPPPDREIWDVIEMEGNRVGYGHKTERQENRDGSVMRLTDAETRMSIKRYGQADEILTRHSTLETLDGRLLSFVSEGLPADATGGVQDGVLSIETRSAGKKTRRTIDWPDDAGGFFALDRSLRDAPLQPGETRTLRYLDSGFLCLVTDELTARDYEPTELPSGTRDLLRIDSRLTIEGGAQPVVAVHWADRAGEVLKSELPSMGLVSYRATEQEATDSGARATFDLGLSSVVPLAQPFAAARQTRRAVYRVELTGGDPAAVFPACPTQQPRAIGPHIAEVTVTSLDPQTSPAVIDPVALPTEGDSAPNSLIQSDDPAVVAMSHKAAGGKKSPLSKALALERYVHENIREKNFATTFASAAEVAQQMSGDCSEHSVLLAALARAAEIPARAAIGLVYAPSEGGFAYHMWNELYIDGRWVPFDATLGEGRVGADRLKLADSDLRDASGLVSFLPVVQVLGKLKIELVEAE